MLRGVLAHDAELVVSMRAVDLAQDASTVSAALNSVDLVLVSADIMPVLARLADGVCPAHPVKRVILLHRCSSFLLPPWFGEALSVVVYLRSNFLCLENEEIY